MSGMCCYHPDTLMLQENDNFSPIFFNPVPTLATYTQGYRFMPIDPTALCTDFDL